MQTSPGSIQPCLQRPPNQYQQLIMTPTTLAPSVISVRAAHFFITATITIITIIILFTPPSPASPPSRNTTLFHHNPSDTPRFTPALNLGSRPPSLHPLSLWGIPRPQLAHLHHQRQRFSAASPSFPTSNASPVHLKLNIILVTGSQDRPRWLCLYSSHDAPAPLKSVPSGS